MKVPAVEAADVETASEGYAARFAGAAGRWMLDVQWGAVRALLPPPQSDQPTILDVGGGHAQLAIPLCSEGYRVTVVGSNESCRRRVAALADQGRCRFVVGDLRSLPSADLAYDIVLCFRLLTHCEDWPELVGELCRTARRAVIVDYPTGGGIHRLAPSLFRAKRRLEGNTRPWRPFRHAELASAFRHHGFEPHARAGQFFFPMALHRLLGMPRISAALEAVPGAVGLTRRWGSPVILGVHRRDTQ